MNKLPTHPNDVYEALLQGCTRKQKRDNLQRLHDLCAAQYSGSRDFLLPTIGRLWAATGGIQARALYNAASADYRTLVQAWSDHAGPAEAKPSEAGRDKSPAFLSRIDDPAIRALVQGALIERDKLRAEVNLLKSVTKLTLDRAPGLPVSTPSTPTPMLLTSGPKKHELTLSERESLERAISQGFFDDQGWKEGRSGEVLNEQGRRVFESGFTKAIRKVLAS
jgi:hypothetical protein